MRRGQSVQEAAIGDASDDDIRATAGVAHAKGVIAAVDSSSWSCRRVERIRTFTPWLGRTPSKARTS